MFHQRQRKNKSDLIMTYILKFLTFEQNSSLFIGKLSISASFGGAGCTVQLRQVCYFYFKIFVKINFIFYVYYAILNEKKFPSYLKVNL